VSWERGWIFIPREASWRDSGGAAVPQMSPWVSLADARRYCSPSQRALQLPGTASRALLSWPQQTSSHVADEEVVRSVMQQG